MGAGGVGQGHAVCLAGLLELVAGKPSGISGKHQAVFRRAVVGGAKFLAAIFRQAVGSTARPGIVGPDLAIG